MTTAVAVLLLGAPQAVADDWGTETADTGAHPDGGAHAYCDNELNSSSLLPNIDFVMNESLDARTDASVVHHTTCDFLYPQTDVRWLQGNLAGTTRGETICAVKNPDNNNCDRFDLTLDLAEINVGTNDDEDQSKTACHELGHSVGLTHGGTDGTDCMVNGEIPTTSETYRTYNTHHRGHINLWF